VFFDFDFEFNAHDEFNIRDKLQKRIEKKLCEVERCNSDRKIDPEHVKRICDYVVSEPHGVINAHGGLVPESCPEPVYTLWLDVGWITLRGVKHVFVFAMRLAANRASCQTGAEMAEMTYVGDRMKALDAAFPARAARIRDYLKQRKIRAAIAHLPKPPVHVAAIDKVLPDLGGIVLIRTDKWAWFAGTPSGWVRVNQGLRRRKSAWLALRDLGFSIPHQKEKRVWNDKMSMQMALFALAE
jgi:hypothetical protein